jgi:hypothetical protein
VTLRIRTKKYNYGWGNPEEPLRCVQVTEKNYVDIANWVVSVNAKGEKKPALAIVKVGKNNVESDHRVQFSTPNGTRVARVGDWIGKEWSAVCIVVKKADFERNFFPV